MFYFFLFTYQIFLNFVIDTKSAVNITKYFLLNLNMI